MKFPLPCLWLLSLLLPLVLPAQALLGERRLKEHEANEVWPYPYDGFSLQGVQTFIPFDPLAATDPGHFVQLWKPRRGSYRDRRLTAYNLFLEQLWETELELGRNETILHFMPADTLVLLLSTEFDYSQKAHTARARTYGASSGQLYRDTIVWTVFGESDLEILFSPSPDGQQLLLYHYYQDKALRRVSRHYDHVHWDDRPGYKARHAEHLTYLLIDPQLTPQAQGTFDLRTRRRLVLDCRPDDAGHVYVTVHERPKQLHVYQRRRGDSTQRHLVYEDFVRLEYLTNDRYAHLPPLAGRGQRFYVSMGEVQRRGRMRGTRAFRVVCFDFARGEVDLRREAEVTSTLLVAVQKQREAFDLRPLRRFENYVLRDLIEMSDSSLWLITQHTEEHSIRTGGDPLRPDSPTRTQYKMEDLILFEFDPGGRVRQALIVPSEQQVNGPLAYASAPYFLHSDPQRKQLRLITREPSGDKRHGPERFFYRFIDLPSAHVSPRLQLYEGKRRNQYFLKAYAQWMNPDILTFMMMDGDNGQRYLVVVNVAAEPDPEGDEEKKRRWWER